MPEAGPNAREHLLLSLGQAAALFPPLEPSLRAPAPEGLDLDTRGAHGFLTQGAPALEQAGFGVLLPSWWTRGGPRTRLTVTGVARPPRMQERVRAQPRRPHEVRLRRSRSAARS